MDKKFEMGDLSYRQILFVLFLFWVMYSLMTHGRGRKVIGGPVKFLDDVGAKAVGIFG